MDKNFSPAGIEARWYEQWESRGYFAPSGQGPAYCIPIPPPNVTGTLHMGHGFQQAIMDALIRYHRMRGHNTLWQVVAIGEASLLAPFAYVGLIYATIWGLVFFGEFPDEWSIIGAIIIAISGFYVWYRDTFCSKSEAEDAN